MDTTRRSFLAVAAAAAATGSSTRAFASGIPQLAEKPMVARIWHGRTPADKADETVSICSTQESKWPRSRQPRRRNDDVEDRRRGRVHGDFVLGFDRRDQRLRRRESTQIHDLPRDKDFLIDREPLVRHFELEVNFWQG